MSIKNFFGLTRFSIYHPGSNSWAATRDGALQDPAELLRYLYADERLQPRLHIFKEYALPIYAKYAANHSYHHIVQYSEEMPEKWKQELHALAEKYPFLVLNSDPKHFGTARPVMEKILQKDDAETSPVAWFRVDDDDLLTEDYLDQLASHTTNENDGKGVSFGYGFLALYKDGAFGSFRRIHKPMLAQGQAFIGRYDAKTRKLAFPKGGNHRDSDRLSPFIVDSRKPAFVWTHHVGQDTRMGGRSAEEQVREYLAAYQTAYGSEIRPLFPTLQ